MFRDIEELCDRMAMRLYDAPIDRNGAADVATVLVFVCRRLGTAVDDVVARYGSMHRTWAVELAVSACVRKLHWLGSHGEQLTDAEMAKTVDRVLHVLFIALRALESEVGQRQPGDA